MFFYITGNFVPCYIKMLCGDRTAAGSCYQELEDCSLGSGLKYAYLQFISSGWKIFLEIKTKMEKIKISVIIVSQTEAVHNLYKGKMHSRSGSPG